jgi:hypothetical protein
MLPKVSCLCPTYGRPQCLEEAIFSFLTQDYQGEKELVILNDLADQTLIFDHPDVKIINVKNRITPLGLKFNETARHATGSVFAVWEDDDIYLPHRLTYSVQRLNQHGLFHTNIAYYEQEERKIIPAGNLFHCNLMVTNIAFWAVDGYTVNEDRGTIDLGLMSRLAHRFGPFTQPIPQGDQFYIYRWGTSGGGYHASGWGSGDVSELAKQTVNSAIQNGTMPQGAIQLVSRWKYNYLEYLPCVT